MANFLLNLAGAMGMLTALVHGYQGETRVFARARIEPAKARTISRLGWQCGTVGWLAVGALLWAAAGLHEAAARHLIILAAGATYGFGAIANLLVFRARHYGWALLMAAILLAALGW